MVIGPPDDHTYCARSAFTHLGLWWKLNNCSLHHFTTSNQQKTRPNYWHFHQPPTGWVKFERGTFRPPPSLEVRASGMGPFDSPPRVSHWIWHHDLLPVGSYSEQEAHQLVGQAKCSATKFRQKAVEGGILDRFLKVFRRNAIAFRTIGIG